MTEPSGTRSYEPTSELDTYPLEMEYLPAEFQKKAKLELNETPENRVNCLRQLRDLIDNENFLISSWLGDDFLIAFLRGGKFDVQRAFISLKKFLKFVQTRKMYFNVKQSVIDIHVQQNSFWFLPYRDKDGCAIGVGLLPRWDPSVLGMDDAAALDILMLFKIMTYPMSQVNGLKLLLDFNVSGWKYIRYCTPFYTYLFYQISQDALPLRIKAVHILNPTVAFKLFYSLLSKFLPDKMNKRFIIHDDVSGLKNYFPESLIPVCFGGRFPDYDISEWMEKAKYPKFVHYLVGYNGTGN